MKRMTNSIALLALALLAGDYTTHSEACARECGTRRPGAGRTPRPKRPCRKPKRQPCGQRPAYVAPIHAPLIHIPVPVGHQDLQNTCDDNSAPPPRQPDEVNVDGTIYVFECSDDAYLQASQRDDEADVRAQETERQISEVGSRIGSINYRLRVIAESLEKLEERIAELEKWFDDVPEPDKAEMAAKGLGCTALSLASNLLYRGLGGPLGAFVLGARIGLALDELEGFKVELAAVAEALSNCRYLEDKLQDESKALAKEKDQLLEKLKRLKASQCQKELANFPDPLAQPQPDTSDPNDAEAALQRTMRSTR